MLLPNYINSQMNQLWWYQMSRKSVYVEKIKLQKWRKYLLVIKKMNLCFKSKSELSPYSVAVPSACKEHHRNLGWQANKRCFPRLVYVNQLTFFLWTHNHSLNPKHTGNVQNSTTVGDLVPSSHRSTEFN